MNSKVDKVFEKTRRSFMEGGSNEADPGSILLQVYDLFSNISKLFIPPCVVATYKAPAMLVLQQFAVQECASDCDAR